MMIGPRRRVPPSRRRLQRWERRERARYESAYQTDAAVQADPITLPITADDVRRIASEGFPLWESVDVMQLRNRRITVAYSDISQRLADLLAGPDGQRDANWCSWASWSSRTIGAWIEHDEVPEPLRALRRIPWLLRLTLIRVGHFLMRRDDGASFRSLAAGNRFVFLEIGLVTTSFIEAFSDLSDRERQGPPDDATWQRYWSNMQWILLELSQLDPSWMLTDAPPPIDLKLGMRQYYEALFIADPKLRAERILAGNLLVAAYEQRRVDGYVYAALALFTSRATRALVRHRSGKMRSRLRLWLTGLYARVITNGLVLNTHDEQLRMCRPLQAPAHRAEQLFPSDLETINTPLLQALLTCHDESDGKRRRRRAHNWTSYHDRMSYITNLFRSRQQHQPMFSAPFPPAVEKSLLDGQLDPGARATVPWPNG